MMRSICPRSASAVAASGLVSRAICAKARCGKFAQLALQRRRVVAGKRAAVRSRDRSERANIACMSARRRPAKADDAVERGRVVTGRFERANEHRVQYVPAAALREDVASREPDADLAAVRRAVGERSQQRRGMGEVDFVQKASEFDCRVDAAHRAPVKREHHRLADHRGEAAVARLRTPQVGFVGDRERFQTPSGFAVQRAGAAGKRGVLAQRVEQGRTRGDRRWRRRAAGLRADPSGSSRRRRAASATPTHARRRARVRPAESALLRRPADRGSPAPATRRPRRAERCRSTRSGADC